MLSRQDKLPGKFQQVSQITFQTARVYQVWLKGLPFAVPLRKAVFTNQDGSTGERCFVSNDTALNFEQITAHYQKRWKVEERHKALKSHVNIEKLPTQPYFLCLDGIYQVRTLENQTKNESFCPQKSSLCQEDSNRYARNPSIKNPETVKIGSFQNILQAKGQ